MSDNQENRLRAQPLVGHAAWNDIDGELTHRTGEVASPRVRRPHPYEFDISILESGVPKSGLRTEPDLLTKR